MLFLLDAWLPSLNYHCCALDAKLHPSPVPLPSRSPLVKSRSISVDMRSPGCLYTVQWFDTDRAWRRGYLLLLRSQLCLWVSAFFFFFFFFFFVFFFCVPSYISGVQPSSSSSSSALPAISLGFSLLLRFLLRLLLRSQLYLWGSTFFFFVFFFCVPSYIFGVQPSSSSFSSFAFPAISLGFNLLFFLLLLRSQLYLWGSTFFFFFVFFFCVPSYISGVQPSSSFSSSSSSAFPAISVGFNLLLLFHLLLRSQLYLWSSPFWVRFMRM